MSLAILFYENHGYHDLLRAASKSSLPEVGGSAALYAASQSGEAYATALHALDSAAVRGDAIRAGLSRIDQFSWSQTMKQTVATYLR